MLVSRDTSDQQAGGDKLYQSHARISVSGASHCVAGLIVLFENLPFFRPVLGSSGDILDRQLPGRSWSQRMPRTAIRQRRFCPCVLKTSGEE